MLFRISPLSGSTLTIFEASHVQSAPSSLNSIEWWVPIGVVQIGSPHGLILASSLPQSFTTMIEPSLKTCTKCGNFG